MVSDWELMLTVEADMSGQSSQSPPSLRRVQDRSGGERVLPHSCMSTRSKIMGETDWKFYNLVLFISSVAVFSLAAQRMSGPKAGR